MTKAQLKEKYTEWNKEITALDERKKEIWEKLKDLCEEKGDGNRWCCMERLVEELTKNGAVFQTMNLVSEYYNIEGQEEALRKLAIATDNFNI